MASNTLSFLTLSHFSSTRNNRFPQGIKSCTFPPSCSSYYGHKNNASLFWLQLWAQY